MKLSEFLRPYKKDLSTTFSAARGKAGVYIIRKKGKVIYVGYSETNLYRTLYRHFQTWTDKRFCPDGVMDNQCNHARVAFYQDTPALTTKQRNAGKKQPVIMSQQEKKEFMKKDNGMSKEQKLKYLEKKTKSPREEKIDYLNEQDYKVACLITTPKAAKALEKSLIYRYKPQYNDIKYQLHELNTYEKQKLLEFENLKPAPAVEFTTGKEDDFEMPF
jgi:hypothetical protein